MNEDNEKVKPTEEQKPSDESQPKLREISKEELKQILEGHRKWLESDEKEGKRANLKKNNLRKADLFGANLQGANLWNADLQGAKLMGANLQKAELIRANLQETNLKGANLQETNLKGVNLQKAELREANLQNAFLYEANLQKADLSKADMQNTILDGVKGLATANLRYTNIENATGLLGNEFAQADVTGTKLPDDIKDFKALETVEKTSQNARKIFFAMLLGCVYSWLTIATTTDVRLLTNTASSPLPIIQTEIPIAGFYWAAPLVLMCLYFYFHLYLDNLWKSLASLPAIFTDGKPLDQTAYPWLLNCIVCRHFKKLRTRPFIARMKEWITIFLAWWVVPITMMAFWLRYIPRHDCVGTIFHIGLIVLSVAFAIYFYRLCALTLQRKEKVAFHVRKLFTDRRIYYGVSIVVVAVLFSLLSYGAINGVRHRKEDSKIINYFVPLAFEILGYYVFADFRERKVSETPSNYWEIQKSESLESIKGANLEGRNLNNANFSKAFLVKANLRDASLDNAYLEQADLRNADLRSSDLQNAYLRRSDLENANLGAADLKNANFELANLKDADLNWADLQNANLGGADLKNALFIWSDLTNADLTYADLTNADLTVADLNNADLKGANFQNVNFQSTRNLTIEQLSEVKTLYKAKLDPELLEQVKKCCPHLLEKPKEGTDKSK